MPDILLRVNGRNYGGWKEARVVRGIRSIAGSFSLTVSERWTGQASAWPILPEDECEISIEAPPPFKDGKPLLTGYVDRRGHRFAADAQGLTLEGRDVNGALVDCSALLPDVDYYNIGVLEFVQKVVAPFGIDVTLQSGISDKAMSFLPSTGGDQPSAGGAGRSSAHCDRQPDGEGVVESWRELL
jgi:prophage tail gpP-like protein